MAKKLVIVCIGAAACVFAGWVIGSIIPLPLCPHSDCHRLGGRIQVEDGPGKRRVCVMSVSED